MWVVHTGVLAKLRDYFQVSALKTRWELDFCSTELEVSDFKNRLNCFMDYKGKNSAQLGREMRRSFLNPTLNFICFFPNIVHQNLPLKVIYIYIYVCVCVCVCVCVSTYAYIQHVYIRIYIYILPIFLPL